MLRNFFKKKEDLFYKCERCNNSVSINEIHEKKCDSCRNAIESAQEHLSFKKTENIETQINKLKKDVNMDEYDHRIDMDSYILPSTSLLKSDYLKSVFGNISSQPYSTLTLPKLKESDAEINIDFSKSGFSLVQGVDFMKLYDLLVLNILYKDNPANVKLVITNFKNNESVNALKKLEKHFLAKTRIEGDAIISNLESYSSTLISLKIELEKRIELFKDAKVSKLIEYNELFCKRLLNPVQGHCYLPTIFVLTDEISNLLKNEIDLFSIYALSDEAKNVGIHFIFFEDVQTNELNLEILFNKSYSLSFSDSSEINVYMEIDESTIEKSSILGNFNELDTICTFIGNQPLSSETFFLPEIERKEIELINKDEFNENELDPLFIEVARIIFELQVADPILIKDRLKISNNRAARIVEQIIKKSDLLESRYITDKNKFEKELKMIYDCEELKNIYNSKLLNPSDYID